MLRWYWSDPSHIVPVEEIEILDRDAKVLKRKIVPLVKFLWQNHGIEEATWESEDSICQQYLYLFESRGKSCNTPNV
ncbi:Chromo domain-containing protein [Gossypium australe]|uniref:Chromo domain-containing protein n=1 Tax=Gossypium australe TaxID=47621 RepID=A0A5B6VLL8_9ROSI|nr:Chromo domain-containing protein [Gossypium australe]